MMRAILVDDERLALRDLERQLSRIEGIEFVGAFLSASDALNQLNELKPDLVFLDIDMPEISGIEAAERIQTINSSIEIVFVTAYEQYAVKAFELDALDYVLKPVNIDRLQHTIGKVRKVRSNRITAVPQPADATVICFQKLQIDYGKAEPFSWRTTRSQELFAYMVYKRNQPVRKDVLIEILWPDTDYKKAYTQLYTTIYQIRKSLERAGISIRLTNSGSDYYLDLGNILVDVQEWENGKNDLPELSMEAIPLHLEWLQAYAGDYLVEHNYSWAENERQRLREIWYKHALVLGQACKDAGLRNDALELYKEIEKKFPFLEEIYEIIMKFHAENGDIHLSKKKYEQLRAMMLDEYGIEPSLAVRQWMERL